MSIDSRILNAYLDYSGARARAGLLECDEPAEGQTVEQWLVEQLRAADRLPEDWEP